MCASIVVTTSRHPTPPVRRLARELASSIYGALRVNRGGMSEYELFLLAKERGASRVVIVGRGKGGNPGRITFIDTSGAEPMHIPFILWLRGVVFLSRARKASAPTPIFYTGGCEELAEDLSLALGIPLYGMFEAGYKDRCVLVECVGARSLDAVIKIVEGGEEIGVKLLVEKVVKRRW